MGYKDSNSRSAQIMRQALPCISKHGGNFGPSSYAVWYEHLAATNPPLTESLNQLLKKSPTLDASAISDLYAEHILSRDARGTRVLQQSLEQLVGQLEQAAVSVSGNVERYALTLEESQVEMQSPMNADRLQRVLQKLLTSTRTTQDSVGELRNELEARKSELSTVRVRLSHLETEVIRDPLTGLLNRRGFDQAVKQITLEGMALTSACLLMLDLDHFKRVNDTYGHLFGDRVLCATAKVLTSILRKSDIAARFGGEEFIVLLPETQESDAVAMAEQFRAAFSRARVRRTDTDSAIDKLTVSIGVTTISRGGTLERAMDCADTALYQAKNDGRDCVRVGERSRDL
ncbi:MAG: GGDEF domain-containing protein [Sediminibacterium sp.]